MKNVFLILILSMKLCFSQNNSEPMKEFLPYKNIPVNQEDYNPGNIVARFIDGLGYRYYWATEGLTTKDLDYKPSEESRSTRQTLDHIFDLSLVIVSVANNEPFKRLFQPSVMPFSELRERTLTNFKKASEAFAHKSEEEISQLRVIFASNEQRSEYPVWNLINGQISDALYHTGQLVSFRRTSGNPMNPNVNVFLGITPD